MHIHSYIYISTYVHMCVRMYVCVYIRMYISHFIRMCMVAEPYSVLYDWTQIMCGASGTIAAVTKERCLWDVSCCLAMNQRRLQGSSLWTDITTLIQFHVVLNESALQCYVEGRLRDTSSFIWNCSPVDEHHSEWQERQTTPLTVQPQQLQWVTAKWKSDVCPWTYAQCIW
jgi:hypothetical protein